MNLMKNKVIVLGSLAFDYIMGFEENFINAVSIDHEKGDYQSTVTANSRIQHFGGTAGNIAYNLGLLNISNYQVVGSVGKDFDSLGYKDKNVELYQLDSKSLSTNDLDFDLFLCIHDDDVLNVIREFDNLPPLLCIELPGDNSFFSQVTLNNLNWALREYLDNNYVLDSRSLLQLKTSNRIYNALNDVHITSSAINNRIRYDIRVNNESLYWSREKRKPGSKI